jgi:cellular nucleic acid-binding protein
MTIKTETFARNFFSVKRMESLYVLKLEKGKWYIGKSADIMKRYQQHLTGSGSAWTSKYPPKSLVESRPITSTHDENNVTKDYMKKYGVENVRGGSYTQVVLDDSTISVLENEFVGNANKCFKCGLAGHFANRCKVKEEVVYVCDHCDREFTTRFGCMIHEKKCSEKDSDECHRCGRDSHWAKDCYAQTHIRGYPL